jgi:hypothetical protein
VATSGNTAGGVNDHRLLTLLFPFGLDMNKLRSLSRPKKHASPEDDPKARKPYHRHPNGFNDYSGHIVFSDQLLEMFAKR